MTIIPHTEKFTKFLSIGDIVRDEDGFEFRIGCIVLVGYYVLIDIEKWTVSTGGWDWETIEDLAEFLTRYKYTPVNMKSYMAYTKGIVEINDLRIGMKFVTCKDKRRLVYTGCNCGLYVFVDVDGNYPVFQRYSTKGQVLEFINTQTMGTWE